MLLLFSILTVLTAATTIAAPLELPQYAIEIDARDLAALYAHPYSDDYVAAVCSHNGRKEKCSIRFRGGSARDLPKKSWRLKFPNQDNFFQAEHINFNAEYRDRSLSRNYLAMRLFHFFGYPAPLTQHVTLVINGEYVGVYLQVEDIDESFLRRNNLSARSLYKAVRHGASMAPLTFISDYPDNWEKKIGPAEDYSELQELSARLFYWSNDDFIDGVEEEIDVDLFLDYIAIEYAIAALDGFTKNFFFCFNEEEQRWQLFPWDNDTSFGNDIRGNYKPDYAEIESWSPLHNQLLFQRLIEFERWKHFFEQRLQAVIVDGFDFLEMELDSTYAAISGDVYEDSGKVCSNEEFDAEWERIKDFLQRRKAFLKDGSQFERTPIRDVFCSTAFATDRDSAIIFRARTKNPADIRLIYAKDLDWRNPAKSYYPRTVRMLDDGMHNDLAAGDLVYGCRLLISNFKPGLYPFAFSVDDLNHPANGLFYLNIAATHTLAFQVTEQLPTLDSLTLGDVYQQGDIYFVELINRSESSMDLSCFHLSAGEYIQNVMIPPHTHLAPRDTLRISSAATFSNPNFMRKNMIGGLYFDILPGDTLCLFSPTMTPLASRIVTSIKKDEGDVSPLVINEINYSSSDSMDCRDWFEIYNPAHDDIDVSNYFFKDDHDNHIFYFPAGARIDGEGFLVVCEDTAALLACYPGPSNVIGNFDFGLRRGGDQIRLFEPLGNRVDSLTYSNQLPWPVLPDDGSKTIELRNPSLDNADGGAWRASNGSGTPGRQNSVYAGVQEKIDQQPAAFSLMQNYPNPFNAKTRFRFSAPMDSKVEIKIYNINGRLVKTFVAPSQHSILWDASAFGSGLYFYQLYIDGRAGAMKKAILIK